MAQNIRSWQEVLQTSTDAHDVGRLDIEERAKSLAEAAEFTERYDQEIRHPIIIAARAAVARLLLERGAPIYTRNAAAFPTDDHSVLAMPFTMLDRPKIAGTNAVVSVLSLSAKANRDGIPFSLLGIRQARGDGVAQKDKQEALERIQDATLTARIGIAATDPKLLDPAAARQWEMLRHPPEVWFSSGARINGKVERHQSAIETSADAAYWFAPIAVFNGLSSHVLRRPDPVQHRPAETVEEDLARHRAFVEPERIIGEMALQLGDPLYMDGLFRTFGDAVAST